MHLSIRSRMLLYIAMPIIIIYIFATGYNLLQFKSLTADNAKEKMSLLALAYANKFNGQLREVAMVAETTAKFVEHHPNLTEDELYTILKDNVLQSNLIYGGVISFEPFAYDSKQSLYCPYVYRGKEGVNKEALKLVDLASTGFDYTQARWEWWHVPRNTSKPIWTEPYFDDGAGEILMATYATAFKKSNKFYGVTTIDIPLEYLRDKLNLGDNENIRFSVLTRKGTFVYNPKKELINHSIYEEAKKSNNPHLKNHADTILSNNKGFFKVNEWNNRSNQWLFYNTIESSNWTLVIDVDENYIFSELYKQMVRDTFFAFVLFIILLVVIFYISRYLSKPIVELTGLADKMIAGNSNNKSFRKHDEIGYLRSSFINMRQSIDEKVSTIQSQNSALLKNKENLEKRVEDRTREIEEKNKKLEVLSITDNLTKLYNRNKIGSVLDMLFSRYKRHKTAFSIMMLDIDYFKTVNDTYGHLVGDEVLIKFAEITKENIRDIDIFGRWGGEEFILILEQIDEEGVISLAEKIRQSIESYEFKKVKHITVSIGISIIDENDDVEQLIHKADTALYKAKKNGRNQSILFTET